MTADIWSDPHHPDCVITHDPADSYCLDEDRKMCAGWITIEQDGGHPGPPYVYTSGLQRAVAGLPEPPGLPVAWHSEMANGIERVIWFLGKRQPDTCWECGCPDHLNGTSPPMCYYCQLLEWRAPGPQASAALLRLEHVTREDAWARRPRLMALGAAAGLTLIVILVMLALSPVPALITLTIALFALKLRRHGWRP